MYCGAGEDMSEIAGTDVAIVSLIGVGSAGRLPIRVPEHDAHCEPELMVAFAIAEFGPPQYFVSKYESG